MALPLLRPLRDVLAAHVGGAGKRVATGVATALLVVVALGFAVSAGLVKLTATIGYPAAALVFAALFAVLALAVHFIGRLVTVRRAERIAEAESRVKVDIALAAALSRSARPLLPLVAFVAAFALARRP